MVADPSHRGDGEWVLTLHVSTPLHYADGELCKSVHVHVFAFCINFV